MDKCRCPGKLKTNVMNKKKIILYIFVIGLLSAVSIWYYAFVYSKNNHRDAAKEKGLVVNAPNLAEEYNNNEQNANAKYLDKTLEVTGVVTEVGKNQDGNVTVALKTNDIMTTVFCTLKDSVARVKPEQTVIVKGICIGFTSDVKIKDAYLINP